jgi:hypothetical protein
MNASVRVTTRTDNVAGVKLPVFVQVWFLLLLIGRVRFSKLVLSTVRHWCRKQ